MSQPRPPGKLAKITDAQRKELESIMESVRFQDSFFFKTLARLQKCKDAVRHRRLSKMWADGKLALEYFAKDANLSGMKRVVDERQRFIDQVITGKVKLFDDDSQEVQ